MIRLNIFGWGLFFRVVILFTACVMSGIVFVSSNWIFTQVILVVIVVLSTLEINRFVSKTNREVSRLIESLKFEEYGVNFSVSHGGGNYKRLFDEINLIKSLHEKRKHNSKQIGELFEKVINELDTGIVLFNESHEILIKSSALDQLFNIPSIKDLTFLESAVPGFIQKVDLANDHAHFPLKNSEYDNRLKSDLECKVMKFRVDSRKYTLLIFSIQKLDNKDNEYETWINFSKVISHEILNGISPLISLTSTLQDKVSRIEGNDRLKASMQEALNIIVERTELLKSNSERYRTLNRLPEPNKEVLTWRATFENAIGAFQDQLEQNHIDFRLKGSSLDGSFKADKYQMDQVISNLILNSIHALDQLKNDAGFISIDVNEDEYKFIIRFCDNGVGIEKNNRANIFLPFYSTRDTGSGIGLAVVKQILWKHEAQIFLSDSNKETCFVMHFPKI